MADHKLSVIILVVPLCAKLISSLRVLHAGAEYCCLLVYLSYAFYFFPERKYGPEQIYFELHNIPLPTSTQPSSSLSTRD
jgi:hypothetical protein